MKYLLIILLSILTLPVFSQFSGTITGKTLWKKQGDDAVYDIGMVLLDTTSFLEGTDVKGQIIYDPVTNGLIFKIDDTNTGFTPISGSTQLSILGTGIDISGSLILSTAPTLNNSIDSVLVRNNVTGEVYLRSASSIFGTESDPIWIADSATYASKFYVNSLDTSFINELQTLSRSNDTIYLSNGGFVVLPSGAVDTDDQTLSIDSTGRRFTISIVDGNSIQFFDSTLTETTVDSYVSNNGYLTSYTETDPVWISDSATYASKFYVNSQGFLTSYTETDPVWISDSATYASKFYVNNQGFLTSYTETDPIWIADSATYASKFYVNNQGFLTSEVDGSITNELQTLSWSAGTGGNDEITLSDGGGTVTITDDVNDADADPANEIQTISRTGGSLTVNLSDGGGSFQDSVLTETDVDAMVSDNGYIDMNDPGQFIFDLPIEDATPFDLIIIEDASDSYEKKAAFLSTLSFEEAQILDLDHYTTTDFFNDFSGANIGQLADVTITSPSSGQVLEYNGSAWVNAAASGLWTEVTNGIQYQTSQGSVISVDTFGSMAIGNAGAGNVDLLIDGFPEIELGISDASGDNSIGFIESGSVKGEIAWDDSEGGISIAVDQLHAGGFTSVGLTNPQIHVNSVGVGIWTDDPANDLHVNGDIQIENDGSASTLVIEDEPTGQEWTLAQTFGGGDLTLSHSLSADFVINEDIRLVGTTTLDNSIDSILVRDNVTGDIKLRSVSSISGGGSLWTANGDDIFYTSTGTGYVGIGTTTPSHLLHQYVASGSNYHIIQSGANDWLGFFQASTANPGIYWPSGDLLRFGEGGNNLALSDLVVTMQQDANGRGTMVLYDDFGGYVTSRIDSFQYLTFWQASADNQPALMDINVNPSTASLDSKIRLFRSTQSADAFLEIFEGDNSTNATFLTTEVYDNRAALIAGNYTEQAILTPYKIHLFKDVTQNVGGANGTTTYISWDDDAADARVDPGYTFEDVTNPSRIEVDATGRYEIYWTVNATQGGAGRTTLMSSIRVNGTTSIIRGRHRNYSRGSVFGDLGVMYRTEVELTAGDYIEAAVTVDDTDATYTINTINAECEIIINRIE